MKKLFFITIAIAAMAINADTSADKKVKKTSPPMKDSNGVCYVCEIPIIGTPQACCGGQCWQVACP